MFGKFVILVAVVVAAMADPAPQPKAKPGYLAPLAETYAAAPILTSYPAPALAYSAYGYAGYPYAGYPYAGYPYAYNRFIY